MKKYIDLHFHLDGAITPEIARHLAKIQEIELPSDDDGYLKKELVVPDNCDSLIEYLRRFDLPLKLLQSAEALNEASFLIAENAKADGCEYVEIRFAPQLHTKNGLTQEEIVKSVIDGLKRSSLKTNVILCLMRMKGNEEQNAETVNVAEKMLVEDGGVVAIDIAGDEYNFPLTQYKDIFGKARSLGIPFTIHAGEAAGAENVRTAIEMGAKRIGHGVRAEEDESVLEMIKEKNIVLEMCPKSNILTHAIENFDNYPLIRYLEKGIKATVNTDGTAVGNTNIESEFRLLKNRLNISEVHERTLIKNSIDGAFTTEKVKKELYKMIL